MKLAVRIAACCLALVLVFAAAFALLKPGQDLLPFSLKNVDGREFTVKVDNGRLTLTVCEPAGSSSGAVTTYPGAVLVDFWATWCVPCRAAMPYMQKLYEKYKPADNQEKGGLRLLGIALDDRGSKVVRPFYEKLKITYPMLADPTAGAPGDGIFHSPQAMKVPYDAIAIPVVYLFDAKGKIVHVHQGFKPEHIAELEEAVKHALAGGK